MIWFDWLIIAVLVYGAYSGMRRGLVLSLFGLAGLVAAVIIGWQFASVLVDFFETQWAWHSRLTVYLAETVIIPQHAGGIVAPDATHAELAEGLLTVVAFFFLFSVVTGAVGFLGRALHLALGWGLTGAINRVMGGLFGLAATAVGAAVALGIMLVTSASVPALRPAADAIHRSTLGPELVRILYSMSPLRDMLFKWLT